MVTAMINATVKRDRIEEFKELAILLTKESRARAGCKTYVFNQGVDNPAQFVLYEQWESEADLHSHIAELAILLGPPRPGEQLPEKLMAMYENVDATFYNTVY